MSKITVTVSGDSGSGKTTIALALVRALMDHNVPVGFVDEDPQPVDIMGKLDKCLSELKRKKTEILITTVNVSKRERTGEIGDEMRLHGIHHGSTSHKAPNSQSVPKFTGKPVTGRTHHESSNVQEIPRDPEKEDG
jgi:Ni2+-binding GTPase involved in maturation of urease and hydrogenase